MALDANPDQLPTGVRPQVGKSRSNRSVWLFGGAAVLAGIGLFTVLEARRAKVTSPATAISPTVAAGTIRAPGELEIPADPGAAQAGYAWPVPLAPQWNGPPMQPPLAVKLAPRGRVPVEYKPQIPTSYLPPASQPAPLPDARSGPQYVYKVPQSAVPAAGGNQDASAGSGIERAKARYFTNPATTLPKGAIIQAVLETALDSTRAGPARAIVSRDVRGFDGSKVLIARGSRLYGEYKADLAAGQNRAMIQWQRLMRPDGAMIDLDSPSADPLGRAGVRGKVNSHFFERFSGMILQSSLDLGVALASRKITDGTIILGLPGSTQTMVAPSPEAVKPTLKVAQGTPVSVFVSRDLDFTDVEQ